MKKFLSFFLVVIMLLVMFASCKTDRTDKEEHGGKTNEETVKSETTRVADVKVDIRNYTIIRSEKASDKLIATIADFRNRIEKRTGVPIKIKDDWVRDVSEIKSEAYEILIGNTNRPESAEVMKSMQKTMFVIQTVGNKIVILGSNDDVTNEAVNYFLNEYVAAGAEKDFISLPENLRYCSEEYKAVSLIENNRCIYNVIYSDVLDNSPDKKGVVDYIVNRSQFIQKSLSKAVGGTYVKLKTDWVREGTDTSKLYEILVGDTSRPESLEAKKQFKVNEYGYSMIGNKIVLVGWSEKALGYAVDMFVEAINNSVTSDSDGNKNILLLSTSKSVRSTDEWVVDIPAYEKGTLEGCVSCNNNQYEYYYTDTTADAFGAYRNRLEGEGYQLYTDNDIRGNIFATYTRGNCFIHTYFIKSRNAVRIITGRNNKDSFLPDNTDGKPEYKKITESQITQMTLDYSSGNFGMCYVITLEDGSFIVFDGGGDAGKIDHTRLYNLLNRLNKRPDKKIVIAAWILTHGHYDHFMGFYNLCMKYGRRITIERFISNIPDSVVYFNSVNPNKYMEDGHFQRACVAVGGIKPIKPHTGMKFWVRNAECEVMFTQEDLYPQKLSYFNDSTMIIRMKIGGQSVIWLGDIYHKGSNIMCEMYGDYLKSDIVQVAHHGYNGGTVELYKNISPEVAFWPCSKEQFNKQVYDQESGDYYVVDRYIYKGLGVKDIFVAGEGNWSVILPFKPGSGKAIKIEVPYV